MRCLNQDLLLSTCTFYVEVEKLTGNIDKDIKIE